MSESVFQGEVVVDRSEIPHYVHDLRRHLAKIKGIRIRRPKFNNLLTSYDLELSLKRRVREQDLHEASIEADLEYEKEIQVNKLVFYLYHPKHIGHVHTVELYVNEHGSYPTNEEMLRLYKKRRKPIWAIELNTGDNPVLQVSHFHKIGQGIETDNIKDLVRYRRDFHGQLTPEHIEAIEKFILELVSNTKPVPKFEKIRKLLTRKRK